MNRNILMAIIFLMSGTFAHAIVRHVSTTGSDQTGDGSVQKPWATLAKACKTVLPDSKDTIAMGIGRFNDPLKDTTVNLPRSVSLLGSGADKTTYVGSIYLAEGRKQVIAGIYMDGWLNKNAQKHIYSGLIIHKGDTVEVRDMRIEGFWTTAIQFGQDFHMGMSNSSLHHCVLKNNGATTTRGFAMRTKSLYNVNIHDLDVCEDETYGGEFWNTGDAIFTNVKVYNCTFLTNANTAAGWEKQSPFCFEWWKVDCLNVEVFNCTFNGSVSLVERITNPFGTPVVQREKSTYSVRLHHNKWVNTIRWAIEIAMNKLLIDSNYIQVDRGFAAMTQWGYEGTQRNLRVHHNVVEGVPLAFVYVKSSVDTVSICNNTVISPDRSHAQWWPGDSTKFLQLAGASNSRVTVANNIFTNFSERPGTFISIANTQAQNVDWMVTNNCLTNALTVKGAVITVNRTTTSDPSFMASGAKPSPWFTLTSAGPCVDAGIAVAGVTDGYAGRAPDIGAYEYKGSTRTVLPAPGSTPLRSGMRKPGTAFNLQGRMILRWERSGLRPVAEMIILDNGKTQAVIEKE